MSWAFVYFGNACKPINLPNADMEMTFSIRASLRQCQSLESRENVNKKSIRGTIACMCACV